MTAEQAAAHRFRLASRPAAGVSALLVLALIAAEWPLAALARQSVNGTGRAGLPWWFLMPFGVVGFVVAWRKPGNPLGWCLVGLTAAGALDQVGSFQPGREGRHRGSIVSIDGRWLMLPSPSIFPA